MVAEWLFGPSGDLRPLPPPDSDIGNAVDRFGGVHNSINGGRTVDVVGYRSRYDLNLPYVEPVDYNRLEAFFTRMVPGPFHLIDPLRKNLLSREAVNSQPADAVLRGVSTSSSSTPVSWIQISGSPVSWCYRACQWSGFFNAGAGTSLHYDQDKRLPLLTAQSMAVSVYVKPTDALTVRLVGYGYSNGALITSLPGADKALTANTWTRIDQATSFDSSVNECRFSLEYRSGGNSASTLQVMCAQAEYGPAATEAAPGGGAVRVEFEDFSAVSPRYPYQTVAMSLLEV